MSADDEQPKLTAWTPSVDDLGGAVYRGRDKPEQRDDPTDAGECRNCGRELAERIQRVVGDNHGRVPGCVECVSPSSPGADKFRSDVSAAGAIRRGNGVLESED